VIGLYGRRRIAQHVLVKLLWALLVLFGILTALTLLAHTVTYETHALGVQVLLLLSNLPVEVPALAVGGVGSGLVVNELSEVSNTPCGTEQAARSCWWDLAAPRDCKKPKHKFVFYVVEGNAGVEETITPNKLAKSMKVLRSYCIWYQDCEWDATKRAHPYVSCNCLSIQLGNDSDVPTEQPYTCDSDVADKSSLGSEKKRFSVHTEPQLHHDNETPPELPSQQQFYGSMVQVQASECEQDPGWPDPPNLQKCGNCPEEV